MGIFWVVVPLYGERESRGSENEFIRRVEREWGLARARGAAYGEIFQKAGAVANSAKHYRPFRQRVQEGERCSLCGEAAVEIGEDCPSGRRHLEKWLEEASEETFKLRGRIRHGEVLCSICLTKRLVCEAFFESRLGLDHHLFPSTADLAVAPFREAVITDWEKVRKEVEDFVEAVWPIVREIGARSNPLPRLKTLAEKLVGGDQTLKKFLHIDGEWFFEESFDPQRVKRVYGLHIPKLLEEAREKLRCLLEAIGREEHWKGPRRPPRYYVLIAADGDRIGDLIAGRDPGDSLGKGKARLWRDFTVEGWLPEWAAGWPRPLSPHYHLAIAKRLRRFALELVPERVESGLARLVYAGGDDVLVLGAANEAPRIIEALREAYASKEVFDGGATLSVAAVILHYRRPFFVAVRSVLELLKKSKR